MSDDANELTVGVIPARFQVPDLHVGHRHLIDYVRERHKKVLIMLGSSGGLPTTQNPLPFEVRAAMVKEAYPDVDVVEVLDHPLSHIYWSKNVDDIIAKRFPEMLPTLYGSRDSFIPKYTGTFATHVVPAVSEVSGTDIRDAITAPTTREGREALIYAAQSRYPICYRTVDVAIIDPRTGKILLIGKDVHNGLLSFPGGFNEQKGESDWRAALRERREELPGIRTGKLKYIGSYPIDDPRYRRSRDGITTTFFYTLFKGGTPSAGDDAQQVFWVSPQELLERLVPWHHELAEVLLSKHRVPWYLRLWYAFLRTVSI